MCFAHSSGRQEGAQRQEVAENRAHRIAGSKSSMLHAQIRLSGVKATVKWRNSAGFARWWDAEV